MRAESLMTFLGMALATYFTRYTMIALLGKELPPRLRRWLHYVPAAVLSALIAPAALAPQGFIHLAPPLWAMAVGIWVSWRTRNVLWTIASGLVAWWLLTALGF